MIVEEDPVLIIESINHNAVCGTDPTKLGI